MENKLRECFDEMVDFKDLKKSNFFSSVGLPSFLRDWVLKKFEDDDGNYDIEEVTKTVERYAPWVDENIVRLGRIKDQPDEVMCEMGVQCACPYECWYYGYCRALTKKERCSS